MCVRWSECGERTGRFLSRAAIRSGRLGASARQGTVSVDVAAGQQVEAYVYGTSATDLHLALAPLQP